MKKLILSASLAVLTAFLFVGCEDDVVEDGSITVQFELVNNGVPVELGENYVGDQFSLMRLEQLKFYISDLKLGSSSSISKDVDVIDFYTGRTSFKIADVTPKVYDGFTMNVGLNATQNASNPIDFATGDPLSASWGLYWSWATKYRFVLMEGRGTNDGALDGTNDASIAMHPGADDMLQTVTFSNGITVSEGSNKTITILIDVEEFWDGPGGAIDLETEPQTHTTPEDRYIAEKFIANFAAAMYIE